MKFFLILLALALIAACSYVVVQVGDGTIEQDKAAVLVKPKGEGR